MTKLARRKFLKGMGAAGLGAASVPSLPRRSRKSMPEIKWRQTTSWPKSLDTLYGGAELIAKRVAALTDNKFQIQTFAGGEIVPGLQVLDAVQKRHRRMRPHRALLLLRQGRLVRLRLGTSIRHEQPYAECLADTWRRARTC